MSTTKRAKRNWSVSLGVTFAAAILLSPALSSAMALDSTADNWREVNLRASLDPSGAMQVEQGSNFQIRISVDAESDIALVLVSSESKAQVLLPHRADTADRASRGTEMLFPDLLSGESLYADMALGKANLYVVASTVPIFQPPSPGESPAWVPLAQVEERLESAVSSNARMQLAIRRIPLQITSPAVKEFVSSEEFVQFYGVGTRSVSNADRGFAVQFAFNSDELADWGRRQLDAVAAGMSDDSLAHFAFLIEGHTDDVGTDEYNMDLSARRAASVMRYLAKHGVQADRLKKLALGKTHPAVEGATEQARAANRRVVIRRLDAAK
jgi:outer membrane protein OmpA-like peptidoglycan-associated protein